MLFTAAIDSAVGLDQQNVGLDQQNTFGEPTLVWSIVSQLHA